MSGDLTWLSAAEIAELVHARDVSPTEVTDHVLGRIEQLDPRLHAFRHVDAAGARRQAAALDATMARGEDPGPLAGVPIGVKEHIAVRGLAGLTGKVADDDDIGVERLRAAGAVIVGTTKMPGMGSFGMFGGAGDTLEDHPRNPWDLTKVPGSSSAGSAAAVAAGMLPVAIGSDGGGSTRLPGAFSGVIGLHPTLGRIPFVDYRMPHTALTISIGPLCRDARDAALVLGAMAGPDGRDFTCLPTDPPDYLADLGSGVEGLRLAWTDDYGYAVQYAGAESPRVIAEVRKAALGLEGLGADVEPVTEVWEDFWTGYVVTSQALKDGPMGLLELPRPDPADYRAAAEARARNRDRFDRLLRDHDVLLSPTSQRLAPTVEEWDDCWTAGGAHYTHGMFAPTYTSHTHMFNWLGWPAVSVPCGFVDGMPIGLQIVGRPDREDIVLRVADAFLRAFPRDERPHLPG